MSNAAEPVATTMTLTDFLLARIADEEQLCDDGDEPPTGPMLRALAMPYADHPDYREEWAL